MKALVIEPKRGQSTQLQVQLQTCFLYRNC